jgi:hypothetical protein
MNKQNHKQNPIPNLSEANRRANLEKAMQIRSERADIRANIKAGNLGICGLLDMADNGNKAASGMRVKQLISSMPGYGSARTKQVMSALGISESRRVGGLGVRQRTALVELFRGDMHESQ